MKLYIVLGKVLLLSAFLIVSNYNLALSDSQARAQFFELYYTWASDFFDKGVFITGYVVRSEWLPSRHINETNRTMPLR